MYRSVVVWFFPSNGETFESKRECDLQRCRQDPMGTDYRSSARISRSFISATFSSSDRIRGLVSSLTRVLPARLLRPLARLPRPDPLRSECSRWFAPSALIAVSTARYRPVRLRASLHALRFPPAMPPRTQSTWDDRQEPIVSIAYPRPAIRLIASAFVSTPMRTGSGVWVVQPLQADQGPSVLAAIMSAARSSASR